MSNLPIAGPTFSSNTALFLGRINLMENWITLNHFHCMKDSALFFFIGIEIFNMHLFPLPKMLPQNLTIHELSDAFIHCQGNSHRIAFDMGTKFTRSKIRDWLMLVEFTDLILFSITGTQMTWYGHFFEWLFSIISYSTSCVAALCRFKLCPVGYSICSESVIDSLTKYGVVSSKVRIPRSMNEILEMGIAFLSVIFSNPLTIFFFFWLLSL